MSKNGDNHPSKQEDDDKSSSSERQQVYGSAPTPMAAESAVETTTPTVKKKYGGFPTLVPSFGSFPGAGSRLGPFFCLGRLGRGTFCSIHRCVDMRYFHTNNNKSKKYHRLVAAKVELTDFANSGVLEGEATILRHLDETLPPQTVPAYMGHFRGDEAAAIVMQYLPGEDMHQLRHRQHRRRLSVEDSVYLTADVMLPLLQRMHDVGVVHRDVKPSNCVRMGTESTDRAFCMVDFGLSKSIVVPKDSTYADVNQPWKGSFHVPPTASTTEACIRKERPKADFRGTSMYASLRIHQLRDYSRRDDMWSLLYVFCDLVSGGLPWMSFAAKRERDECQRLKERIHGDKAKGIKDETEKMLMGEDYYVSLYNREVAKKHGADESEFPELAKPLAMANDSNKVHLLRTAFEHVASLGFSDQPDYDLIRKCIRGFLHGGSARDDGETVASIDWKLSARSSMSQSRKRRSVEARQSMPSWDLVDFPDPLDNNVLDEADAECKTQSNIGEPTKSLESEEKDMTRLPLVLQFRMAQMEYNTKHASDVAPHLALRDWLKCALELLYGKWDSLRYEKGNHRSDTDGYRRELYLKLLEKCDKCAKAFSSFRGRSCFYETANEAGRDAPQDARPKKRRKIVVKHGGVQETGKNNESLSMVSRALFGIRTTIAEERRKQFAPPPSLAFGVGESAMR